MILVSYKVRVGGKLFPTPLIKPTVWELTTHDCGSRWANQPGCVYGLGLYVPCPKETSGTNFILKSTVISTRDYSV